jgi:hypothetical protein
MKLYEMTDQFRKLEEMAMQIDSAEDAEAFSALWAEIAGDFMIKAERTAMVIRNLEAECDAMWCEEDRLKARRKSMENNVVSLKGYLESHMKETGIDKVTGTLFTISIQKNPPALKLDEGKLPEAWWKVKREPDSAKIKEAIKSGESIEGAWLEQGESLRIR